jgi:ATP-dependent helicase HepA
LKTLRLSEEARRRLLEDFQKIPRKPSPAYRQWETWLKGGDPHLSITFDGECAASHPQTAFITPVHPLTIQTARSMEQTGPAMTVLKVKTNNHPVGTHLFSVYQWRFHGIRENLVLRPIAMDDTLTAKLPALLETAESLDAATAEIPDISAWDTLDARHYALWTSALKSHRQRTMEIAKFQKESLFTSHEARMALLNEQLAQAGHEKIRKMRESQIVAAEADYSRRIQQLDIARERADIAAQPMVFGVISIEGSL